MAAGKDRNTACGDVIALRPARPGLAASSETVMLQMHDHLGAQTTLCHVLETIADRLPNDIDTQECLIVARSIYPIVKRAHAFEEAELFPLLQSRRQEDTALNEAIGRLQFEHWEDESFAGEVAEALTEFVRHRETANAEALGYMLRGFFEGLRRHIAFEREHIFPILSKLDENHAPV